MSAEDLRFLLIGCAAVICGATVVVALVQRELAPSREGKGNGSDLLSQRLLLAGVLGMGVVAFAIKLVAFALLTWLPRQTIAPLMVERRAGDIVPASWKPVPPPVPPNEPYRWQTLPATAPAPADNPTTAAKVVLGQRLFFDRQLSRDRQLACASCHDVEGGAGADGRATSLGIGGQLGRRNAPTVWNAGFQALLFWDGRASSLEEQAKGPPLNPIEMGMPSGESVARRVEEDPAYAPLFSAAFGDDGPISFDRIAKAIAAYERTLIAADTPYDRFIRGDRQALNGAQLRGMALFQSTGCVACHSGPNFSAAAFAGLGRQAGEAVQSEEGVARFRVFPANNTPLLARYDLLADKGAAAADAERGVWRVPSLRNVALTGPWLHNGAVTKLEEVVRIMASAQLGATLGPEAHRGRRVFWSPAEQSVSAVDRPALSETDVKDIVAFLEALSSDRLLAQRHRSSP